MACKASRVSVPVARDATLPNRQNTNTDPKLQQAGRQQQHQQRRRFTINRLLELLVRFMVAVEAKHRLHGLGKQLVTVIQVHLHGPCVGGQTRQALAR